MLSNVKIKVRALIEDLLKSGSETFTYTSSNIFTLIEPNAVEAIDFTIDGAALDSGEIYALDTDTNKVTLSGITPTAGQEIEINYTYYAKYSETEIREYIRASLVWISLFGECKDFELEEDGEGDYNFEPTPTSKQLDLIALITSILIKPDWNEYKLPNLTVKFPRTQDRDTKIRKLIVRLQSMVGEFSLIDLEG